MEFSSYKHVNRDRLFFEGFYIIVINICDDAMRQFGRRPDIERALGHIFRGRHFNLYARLNQPLRSVNTLSIKELYAVKHETSNRALNAKLLSALNARPPVIHVSAAAVAHSPLVADFITSVVTARSLMKDPALRQAKRAFSCALAGSVRCNRPKICHLVLHMVRKKTPRFEDHGTMTTTFVIAVSISTANLQPICAVAEQHKAQIAARKAEKAAKRAGVTSGKRPPALEIPDQDNSSTEPARPVDGVTPTAFPAAGRTRKVPASPAMSPSARDGAGTSGAHFAS
jgi:hypothetical protein